MDAVIEGEHELRAQLRSIGFSWAGDTAKYVSPGDYVIEVVFDHSRPTSSRIRWGTDIRVHHNSVSTFRQPETLVVLSCVISLLDKGYPPTRIELEKTWPVGRGHSGRLDVLLLDPSNSIYAMIECKTWGREYNAERNRILENGGQLFTYFAQARTAKFLYLYSAKVGQSGRQELAEYLSTQDLVGGDVLALHESWNKSLTPTGVFHPSAGPYDNTYRGITFEELRDLDENSGLGVFNAFAEILRRHVVSDKPNAFNKIFNLFLCKITDEDSKSNDDEMDFQWKTGDDGHSLLSRLSELYFRGMKNYLEVEIDPDFHAPLSEFAFIDVYSRGTWVKNVTIVRETVELLQQYRIKYSSRHQYLGDFFEMLLSTGVKQEAGQFFTPVPLARAIVRSLPLESIVSAKVDEKSLHVLPFLIDYACGAGHFLTEAIEEIQDINHAVDTADLSRRARQELESERSGYHWTKRYIYGIEKDQRLAKVTKIATFLNGDGDANIIQGDGLAPFDGSGNYRELLLSSDGNRNLSRFDVVVANPPFAVPSFRRDLQEGKGRFRLFEHLSTESGEIECLFLERTGQLLRPGGVFGVIFPLSLLSNSRSIYRAARRLICLEFDIRGLLELREKTFIGTPTTTVCLFGARRSQDGVERAAERLLSISDVDREVLEIGGMNPDLVAAAISDANIHDPQSLIELAYGSDTLANAVRIVLDASKPVVMAFTGESNREQERVLGYRFSRSRGSEGLNLFTTEGRLQSLLLDTGDRINPNTISGHILASFEGKYPPVPASLAKFAATLQSNLCWSPTNWTISNPSAYLVSSVNVSTYSPFGDFLDEMETEEELLDSWIQGGRCKTIRGAVYNKRTHETAEPTRYRILTATNLDLRTRELDLSKESRFLRDDAALSDEQMPRVGDIIYCSSSGSLAHLGKIAVVKQEIEGCYIGGFLLILRAADYADRKILEYNLLSLRFRSLVSSAKEQNISNFGEGKLKTFALRVPRDKQAFLDVVRQKEAGYRD